MANTYGIAAWTDGNEIVNTAKPYNHVHSIEITNQAVGTFEYDIPAGTGGGILTMTYGKITDQNTSHSQGGAGRACVGSYALGTDKLTLTMINIPDPNMVSAPLYFNFFLRRP